MKIVHVSLPAQDPRVAAEVLADIMGGEAMRFPPGGPDAWMAWSADGMMELETIPHNHLLRRNDKEGAWIKDELPRERATETHLAVCVETAAEEVLRIATAAGWPARICHRSGRFHLVEVWMEDALLIEFLDPEQTREYKEAVNPEIWKHFLSRPKFD